MIGPGTGCSPFRSYINEQRFNASPSFLRLFSGSARQNVTNLLFIDYYVADDWARDLSPSGDFSPSISARVKPIIDIFPLVH